MITYATLLTDSLEKVLPDCRPREMTGRQLTTFRGETVSFQLAARAIRNTPFGGEVLTLSLSGEAAGWVRVRRVLPEPVMLAAYADADDNYLTKTPGMLPDILMPFEDSETPYLRCIVNQWSSLWCDFTVDAGQAPGDYPLELTVSAPDGTTVGQFCLTVTVRPEALQPQTLYHTEWFHTDCLADYYHVPAWSEEHWRIIDRFMAAAAGVGINMLLTPVFTPPLDTAVGGERTTVQLVEVTEEDDGYRFGFDRLGRWIALCRKNGITELEISHLFTQWGAAAAPKIVSGDRRLFGWNTPAVGGEYTRFLQAFLPELKAYLAEQGMLEHSWFHISDEPNEGNMEQWNAARLTVAPLLEDCHLIDALSSFEIYKRGYIQTPVVALDHIEPFAAAQVPGLWGYYCCGEGRLVPNRFMAMPSARSRILGVLLYRYHLAGFLQWGFNFYNGERSTCRINPYVNGDGYGSWQAGDPFLVYPAADGSAIESLRAAVVREAMQDLRMLQTAETRLGRESVEQLVDGCWNGGSMTMEHYPTDPAYFSRLRDAVTAALDKS